MFAAGATDFALQEISAWPTRFETPKQKKSSLDDPVFFRIAPF